MKKRKQKKAVMEPRRSTPRVSEEKESFGDKVLMGATVVVSIAVAVGLFMILPFFISNLFSHVTSSVFLLSLIEGIVRVILFLGLSCAYFQDERYSENIYVSRRRT